MIEKAISSAFFSIKLQSKSSPIMLEGNSGVVYFFIFLFLKNFYDSSLLLSFRQNLHRTLYPLSIFSHMFSIFFCNDHLYPTGLFLELVGIWMGFSFFFNSKSGIDTCSSISLLPSIWRDLYRSFSCWTLANLMHIWETIMFIEFNTIPFSS